MHQDIITALDESRINEPKLVYKYKENDLEETKSLDEAVEVIKNRKREYGENEKQELEETKSEKKILIILQVYLLD